MNTSQTTNTIRAAADRILDFADSLAYEEPVDAEAVNDHKDVLRTSLPMRDMLIASAMTDHATDREKLIGIAADPQAKETGRLVYDLLTATIRDADAQPPIRRMTAIADGLENLTGEKPERGDAQFHATAAYLYWMTGDEERAELAATKALLCDGTNTMAAIVLTAICRGMKPAYLH